MNFIAASNHTRSFYSPDFSFKSTFFPKFRWDGYEEEYIPPTSYRPRKVQQPVVRYYYSPPKAIPYQTPNYSSSTYPVNTGRTKVASSQNIWRMNASTANIAPKRSVHSTVRAITPTAIPTIAPQPQTLPPPARNSQNTQRNTATPVTSSVSVIPDKKNNTAEVKTLKPRVDRLINPRGIRINYYSFYYSLIANPHKLHNKPGSEVKQVVDIYQQVKRECLDIDSNFYKQLSVFNCPKTNRVFKYLYLQAIRDKISQSKLSNYQQRDLYSQHAQYSLTAGYRQFGVGKSDKLTNTQLKLMHSFVSISL